MENQVNENGGLRLKDSYTESDSGTDYSGLNQNTYHTYNDPYQGTNSFYEEPYRTTYTETTHSSVSEIMTGSFMYMFIALLVTGITGLAIASSPMLLYTLFNSSGSIILLMVLELGIVFAASSAMKRNKVVLSGVLFFAYAVINGFTLSLVFIVYTATSIEHAFFATAAVFGVMAFIGKVTDRDLTSLGSLLLIGLIGVILTSIVNLFIGSTVMDMAISAIAIVIFLGLTAYDTQKIKVMAENNARYSPAVISLWGAMELYLDFINLFLRIIRLMGREK